MKKLLSLLLALIMVFSLVACSNDQGNNETPDDKPSTSAPTENNEQTPQ